MWSSSTLSCIYLLFSYILSILFLSSIICCSFYLKAFYLTLSAFYLLFSWRYFWNSFYSSYWRWALCALYNCYSNDRVLLAAATFYFITFLSITACKRYALIFLSNPCFKFCLYFFSISRMFPWRLDNLSDSSLLLRPDPKTNYLS